jgi:hypothetical protein
MQIKNRAGRKLNIPQQLYPLGILFIIAITALIIVRQLLVPPTFGEYGHYRAQAIEDNLTQPISYAGYYSCNECHDDLMEKKNASHHQGVACEVCHGPAAKHIEDPSEYLPDAPRDRGFCPLCHGFDPARPSGFPQIIPALHNPGRSCIFCHDPHEPEPPHAPEECSACHRKISNQKSVSHHATLACTVCHDVTDDHLVNPRLSRAQKPTERTLCGQCHSRDADKMKGVPRIDMAVHGERYQCWDCHYPHSPEAY